MSTACSKCATCKGFGVSFSLEEGVCAHCRRVAGGK